MSQYQDIKLTDRYAGMSDEDWGGEAGRYERLAAHSARVSHHRREARRDHELAHRWRLLMFGLMAVLGFALLGHELCQWTPTGWHLVLGIGMVLPWLVELGEV